MKMFRLLLAPLMLVLALAPARAAEELSLDDISRYLNGLRTVQADFTQINADGSISTGKIYISRPGKARFEYNPPNEALVIAGGQQLAIFDPKSNDGPTQYPLKRTPLKLILARKIDLGREDMVVGREFDGISTTVTAQDPENPEYGTIAMTFTDNPVELRQWVITDDVGDQTTVILGLLQQAPDLSLDLFNINREIARRSR
ncbi:MAG TPA: outer membrane lipoprotein carrier protein LolA [Aliiroseovarius sp.]|nr:outer membrane lipoprotein carrier protein LolA [Aliiroseovarius sp.]